MKNTIKNKKPLLVTTSLIAGTALILSPMAVAISCRDNQINNEIVEPILPPTSTDPSNPSNPTLPPVDPSLPIVNSKVLMNDYLSYETGKPIFDLSVFEGKTLDEIDFNLIKKAMILDSSTISAFAINTSYPIIKNYDLNYFSFVYAVDLVDNEYYYIHSPSYATIYLPLQVDSKETLNVNSFKELAQKATSEQYLNSFNETLVENNVMFQNIFDVDSGIDFWKSNIGQLQEPFLYKKGNFEYNLNNDEVLKYSILSTSGQDSPFYRNYTLTIKNVSSNKYEKIIVNGNTYLRITMGKDAVELYDNLNAKSYTNTHETTFYINITNWNK